MLSLQIIILILLIKLLPIDVGWSYRSESMLILSLHQAFHPYTILVIICLMTDLGSYLTLLAPMISISRLIIQMR